jgi:biotin-(acetyl-CoA carboxylase) ligase
MITGVCEDVRDDGAMLLLDETGQRHHITTGDVKLIGG